MKRIGEDRSWRLSSVGWTDPPSGWVVFDRDVVVDGETIAAGEWVAVDAAERAGLIAAGAV